MKQVLVVALVLFVCSSVLAQKKEVKKVPKVSVPAAVIKAFQKEYPNVTNVGWITKVKSFDF